MKVGISAFSARVFIVACFAFVLTPFHVSAHSFYEIWCCNKRDCAPIPATSVKATPTGYIVTLNHGDHPRITEKQVFHVAYINDPKVRIRNSLDGDFHACLYPSEKILRCFYIPPASF